MARYAESTSVPADRSRAQIERTLTRYGADQFMYGWSGDDAVVAFRMNDRQVRFLMTMPDRSDREFTRTPTGRTRTAAQAQAEWEQATRQRWRALELVIKAKLEAVKAGIVEFEQEFLAHIVMPDGRTVGEHAMPAVAEAYETGRVVSLLPEYRRALAAG